MRTRLPIRLRVTLAFAAGLGVVVVAFGAFVYGRTGAVLLAQIDAGLRSRAEVVAADVQSRGPTLADIEPSLTGGAYINFLSAEGEERVRAAYGEAKFARLQALKDEYDPTNLFHRNQNIPPSGV